MAQWYMVTLVGKDQPGIVAAVTNALYEKGANLGEAHMQRIGGYFTIMLMVDFANNEEELLSVITPAAANFGLRAHVDAIQGELHHHLEPDVQISIYGADRAGIVANATKALAAAGLHILALETDVGGSPDSPIFILQIEGHAANGIDAIRSAVADLEDLDIKVEPIDTLIG